MRSMMMRSMTWLAGAMLALAACSPGGAEAAKPTSSTASAPASVHRESGLPVVALIAWPGGGKPHTIRVEVARTREEQARGLMFRTRMGADEGMIFPMDPPRMAAFWMRNTVIPLDIIFIGQDRRILNIAARAVPYSETPLPSAGPVSAVLELNGGRAAELGLVPGDRIDW